MLCFFMVPCWTLAHDSPATVISQLTATMAHEGVSAELFFRRATEFRAIRYYQRAAYDLTQALALDNNMVAARLELARLQLQDIGNQSRSKSDNPLSKDPLETIASLTTHEDQAVRTAAIALRGEIHLAKQNWGEATSDFTQALSFESNLSWYLWRAEAQMQLGLDDDAIDGLEKAYSTTQSPVVRKHLCDIFLIAAMKSRRDDTTLGRSLSENSFLKKASKIIEEELVDNRLTSSWRIRSGKLHMLYGDSQKARKEFIAALEELDSRLETPYPDFELVQDRKTAQSLLSECVHQYP
jgi:tetratricopeptide (TPR) repeat protein